MAFASPSRLMAFFLSKAAAKRFQSSASLTLSPVKSQERDFGPTTSRSAFTSAAFTASTRAFAASSGEAKVRWAAVFLVADAAGLAGFDSAAAWASAPAGRASARAAANAAMLEFVRVFISRSPCPLGPA